jgi:hypothetical protein
MSNPNFPPDQRHQSYSNRGIELKDIIMLLTLAGGFITTWVTLNTQITEIRVRQELKFDQVMGQLSDAKELKTEYEKKFEDLHGDLEDLRATVSNIYNKLPQKSR